MGASSISVAFNPSIFSILSKKHTKVQLPWQQIDILSRPCSSHTCQSHRKIYSYKCQPHIWYLHPTTMHVHPPYHPHMPMHNSWKVRDALDSLQSCLCFILWQKWQKTSTHNSCNVSTGEVLYYGKHCMTKCRHLHLRNWKLKV